MNTYEGLLWCTLENGAIFEVSGRDCVRYLHSRLTQNIAALPHGSSAMAAALSAQGRVEGLFCVFRESLVVENTERFLILSDGGDRSELLSILSRFVVADRINFVDSSNELKVIHIAASSKERLLHVVAVIQDRLGAGKVRVQIERKRLLLCGVDLVVVAHQAALVEGLVEELLSHQLTKERYDILRWQAGCAIFPEEINSEGMILEYGLREAVSFSKGCYVGQEVVERSDAVGKIPRFLERLEIDLAQPALVGSDLVINQQQLKGASISNVSGEVLGRVVGVIADRISYQDKRGGSELISSFKLFALLRNGRYKVEDELFCGEGLKCRIVR